MKHRPWDNSFENKKYEKWIRKQGCLVCGSSEVVMHHVHHARNNCYMGVPLCVIHHTFGEYAYHVLEHDNFEDHHRINLDWEIQKLLMKYIQESHHGKEANQESG